MNIDKIRARANDPRLHDAEVFRSDLQDMLAHIDEPEALLEEAIACLEPFSHVSTTTPLDPSWIEKVKLLLKKLKERK